MILEELFESATPILFHYTSVEGTFKILDSNEFKTKPDMGNVDKDAYRTPGKHFKKNFYFSTARAKHNRYVKYIVNGQTCLVLDGDKLNHRYHTKPINYWGSGTGSGRPTASETEDRVFTTKDSIPNAASYIKSIHIYSQSDNAFSNFVNSYARKVMIKAKQVGIPVFVYDDELSFKAQNTKRAIPFEELQLKTKSEKQKSRPSHNPFKPYTELLFKKSVSELGSEAREIMYNLRYEDKKPDGTYSDYANFKQVLAGKFNNYKRPNQQGNEYFRKFVRYLSDLNIKDFDRLMNHLKARWDTA